MKDIRNDPRWDSKICVNCGGIIGCEYCPKLLLVRPLRKLSLVPITDADPGDENDFPNAA